MQGSEIMYRKIQLYLEKWKDSEDRKPLVLQGARQVGKTYAVLDFAKRHYKNVIYLNFETNQVLIDTFNENLSPDYLLPIFSKISGIEILEEDSIIIFDEVQICDKALTSLKYFYESAPQYHIIAAGSLLGVALNREGFSFPVGKVDIKTLYPMDMEEFLLALGEEDLLDKIRYSYENDSPMPKALHEYALELYRKYLLVGGMPECVLNYVNTENYTLVRHLQDNILLGYMNDMSKYNTKNEIRKTRLTYESVTVQLSKENTRFKYKLIKKGARASEFENAIEWLELSGVISKLNKVEQIKKPLENYRDIDDFKIYFSDTGLMSAKMDLSPNDILYMGDDMDDFKGGMTENYVNTQLITSGHRIFYWRSKRNAEIDFVLRLGDDIVPIEVKSANNTRAKSLSVYRELYKPKYSIKLSTKNFAFENGIKSVPLYAAYLI